MGGKRKEALGREGKNVRIRGVGKDVVVGEAQQVGGYACCVLFGTMHGSLFFAINGQRAKARIILKDFCLKSLGLCSGRKKQGQ